MSNKKITVRTGSLEEAAKEFIDIWHQVEQGNAPQAPVEKISSLTVVSPTYGTREL